MPQAVIFGRRWRVSTGGARVLLALNMMMGGGEGEGGGIVH